MTRHLLLTTAFGLVMATAAGIHTAGVAAVIAVLAGLAVLAGIRFRAVGTFAVLLATAAITLTDVGPVLAGVAGLAAACYLVARHIEGQLTAASPILLAALGFTVVGVVAAALPFDLPWLPLLAPPVVFVAYVLALTSLGGETAVEHETTAGRE